MKGGNAIIEDIASSIVNRPLDSKNYGLLSGMTGDAIFLYEYSKMNPKYKPYIEETLGKVFLSIEESSPYPYFCAGIAGACLGIEYVMGGTLGNRVPFDFVEEDIDLYIEEEYLRCLEINNLDFLHGALGIAMYYLERLKTDSTFITKINVLLDYLNVNGIEKVGTIRWLQKDGKSNISLSHGMASILIFLCELSSLKYRTSINIQSMIRKIVNYFISQEIDSTIYGSMFPYDSLEGNKHSRLAWCYGDLGIALALFKASQVLNDYELEEKAFSIIDFAGTRRDLFSNSVFDTSICHGTAGIALIFNEFYLKNLNKRYLDAKNYWVGKTIELYNENKIFYKNTGTFDSYRPSLLEGNVGVGLSLLTIQSKEANNWTKFLLIK